MGYFEHLIQKFKDKYSVESLKKLAGLEFSADFDMNSAFETENIEMNSEETSIFEDVSSNSLENINYEYLSKSLNGIDVNNINISSTDSALKEFLSLESIKNEIDEDGDGEITSDEVKKYVKKLSEQDGDSDSLSVNDFDTVIQSKLNDIENPTASDIENSDNTTVNENMPAVQETTQEMSAPTQVTETPPIQNPEAPASSTISEDTPSVQNTTSQPASDTTTTPAISDTPSSVNSNQSSYNTATSRESSEALEQKKANKEKELEKKQKYLEDAKSDNTKPIKNAIKVKNDAEDKYLTAVKKDENISKELKEEIKENIKNINKNENDIKTNNENIKKSEETLDDLDSKIEDKESEIETCDDYIEEHTQLIEKEVLILSGMDKPTGKKEDKERDKILQDRISAMQRNIAQHKNELDDKKKEKAKLEKEKSALDEEYKKEEDNNKELIKKGTELEAEKELLNIKKEDLDKQVQELADKKTVALLEAYNKATQNLKTTKENEIKNTETAITNLESEIDNLESQIQSAKIEEANAARYGSGAGGASQDATIYTNAASGESTGNNFTYTSSSQQIKQEAIRAGHFSEKNTYTPKRGDIAIWTKRGDPAHGHVGVVDKVYEDGSFDVIEGNSGNRVKRNHYRSQDSADFRRSYFAGFCRSSEWMGEAVAENAARVAENELAKGVREIGSSNDSPDIARYKRGHRNNNQWCAYFTSYCFHDGQSQLT